MRTITISQSCQIKNAPNQIKLAAFFQLLRVLFIPHPLGEPHPSDCLSCSIVEQPRKRI